MTLNEMIYKRRSCRSYTGIPVDEKTIETIKAFSMKPLHPEIKVHWDIVSRNQVHTIFSWTPPQLIAIYSEETEGWLENVGFLFQQMDLYLQSLGLGACWMGIGRMNAKTAPVVEGMRFVILLAFGHPKGDQLRHEEKEFKRKSMEQIADQADPRLEPVRLAPSAMNSQPWYFTHEKNLMHAYRIPNEKRISYMNRIDMGIALAHLYVTNEETFRFCKLENPPTVSDLIYVGSISTPI